MVKRFTTGKVYKFTAARRTGKMVCLCGYYNLGQAVDGTTVWKVSEMFWFETDQVFLLVQNAVKMPGLSHGEKTMNDTGRLAVLGDKLIFIPDYYINQYRAFFEEA